MSLICQRAGGPVAGGAAAAAGPADATPAPSCAPSSEPRALKTPAAAGCDSGRREGSSGSEFRHQPGGAAAGDDLDRREGASGSEFRHRPGGAAAGCDSGRREGSSGRRGRWPATAAGGGGTPSGIGRKRRRAVAGGGGARGASSRRPELDRFMPLSPLSLPLLLLPRLPFPASMLVRVQAELVDGPPDRARSLRSDFYMARQAPSPLCWLRSWLPLAMMIHVVMDPLQTCQWARLRNRRVFLFFLAGSTLTHHPCWEAAPKEKTWLHQVPDRVVDIYIYIYTYTRMRRGNKKASLSS